jgi:hypothetical protein
METLAALLLILPRTTALGALLGCADLGFVLVLNLCFDVNVKLYAFNLLLMSLFLLAPEIGRLARLFFLGARVELSTPAPWFASPRLNRGLLGLQVLLGLFMVGRFLVIYIPSLTTPPYGYFAPKSPLYGIWSVEEITVDGQLRPPLLTDETRWRKMVFDSPDAAVILIGDHGRRAFKAQVDLAHNTLILTDSDNPKSVSTFSLERAGPWRLSLTGDMDDHRIQAELLKFDQSKFILPNDRFHWLGEQSNNQ